MVLRWLLLTSVVETFSVTGPFHSVDSNATHKDEDAQPSTMLRLHVDKNETSTAGQVPIAMVAVDAHARGDGCYQGLAGDCTLKPLSHFGATTLGECQARCTSAGDACKGVSFHRGLTRCYTRAAACDTPAGSCDATANFCFWTKADCSVPGSFVSLHPGAQPVMELRLDAHEEDEMASIGDDDADLQVPAVSLGNGTHDLSPIRGAELKVPHEHSLDDTNRPDAELKVPHLHSDDAVHDLRTALPPLPSQASFAKWHRLASEVLMAPGL